MAIANASRAEWDKHEQCRFIEADFHKLPDLRPIHFAYAIEAFVHSPNADLFFEQVAGQLSTGGKLVLCDDFLMATDKQRLSPQERRWIQDYQEGWLAGSLMTVADAEAKAKAVGLRLIDDQNLTPYMEIGRPRDQLIGLMKRVAGRWMRRSIYFRSMIGGYGKQQCLKRDVINYRLLTFESVSDD